MEDDLKGTRHRYARRPASRVTAPEQVDRRVEICEKAFLTFTRYGYRKTTVEDIGKACGLGKAALYYYFSSKEEIFAELVRAKSERLLVVMETAVKAAADPRARLVGLVKARLQAIGEMLLGTAIVAELEEVLPAVNKLRQDCFDKEVRLVERVLADGVRRRVFKQCDTRSVALLIVRGMDLYFTETHGAPLMADGLEATMNLFFDGICR